jgi:hypothetical protein
MGAVGAWGAAGVAAAGSGANRAAMVPIATADIDSGRHQGRSRRIEIRPFCPSVVMLSPSAPRRPSTLAVAPIKGIPHAAIAVD